MDHITVCVPTFRRLVMLERLLRNLALQETGGLFELSVVVVDNDAAGSARDTTMRIAAELSLPVRYEIEPERSIPIVRNRALRLAKGNYIGIIDDDEFPPPHWLLTLYRGIHTFNVDGALGPVHPFFDRQPPSWLLKSRLCELPLGRTGTLLRWNQTRTGNVLLKKAVFDEHDLCFDPKFKTGGSDQEFFRQAIALGCSFVAVEDAPVYEIVPPERWTRTYWIKRALVNGFNAHKYAIGDKSLLTSIKATLKSSVALLAYLIAMPICALRSHRFINCLQSGCWHLSRLCASLGIELWKKRDF